MISWHAVEISGRAAVQGVDSDKAAKVMKLLESKMVRCWLQLDGLTLFSDIVWRILYSKFASVRCTQPVPLLQSTNDRVSSRHVAFQRQRNIFSIQAGD